MRVEGVSTELVSYVELAGKLDESFAGETLRRAIERRVAVLNLKGIESINSAGADKWKEALGAISEQIDRLLLVECSTPMVERFNADHTFVTGGEVVSVCTRLLCEACGREATVIIDVDQPVTEETLRFACAQCDSPLAPATDRETYFAFCDAVPLASLGEEAQEAIIAFDNRDQRADPAPDSEAAAELRAAAEAIAAAETDEEQGACQELEELALDPDSGEKEIASSRLSAAESDATVVTSWEPEPRAKPDFDAEPPSARQPTPENEPRAKPDFDAEPPSARQPTPENEPRTRGRRRRDFPEAPVGQKTQPSLCVEDEVVLEGEESDPDPSLGIASAPPSHAKTSPSLHVPTLAKRVRRLAQALVGNTMASIAVAVAAASWLLLLLVVAFGRPAGIPPDDLMRYYQSIHSTEFDQAEKLLATYSDKLPEELRDAMHADLEQRVQRATEQLDRRARQALARGDLDSALEQAEAALEIREDDLDMLFVAAEALRRLERSVAAVGYYERFVTLADEDSRLDDALFWQAEALVSKSQLDKARALYTRILEMEASNFKTSAQRRLAEIGE